MHMHTCCIAWGMALVGDLTGMVMVTFIATMPSYVPSVPSFLTPNSPRRTVIVALYTRATLNLPRLPLVSCSCAPPHLCGDVCMERQD